MYKLIALDMDGTLLRGDGSISERTKSAIKEARKQGVKVVLASGRPLEGLERYLDELELTTADDYALSYNGAVIKNVGTKETICSQLITGKDVRDVYAISQQIGVNTHAFSTELGLISPKVSHYTAHERDINGIPLTLIDFNELSEDHPIVKVMLVDEPEILSPGVEQIPVEYYDRFTVVRSAPFFLEILNKNSNKGNGVSMLANYLGIKPEEVICVGDAGNDVHMLEYAGLSVAMGNAFDDIKAIADYVTHTNEEDGVAHVIEKFILS
jgi:Cof subfamily protein (haloacid dehalogenase superfamily)